jgi:hypothetical protein
MVVILEQELRVILRIGLVENIIIIVIMNMVEIVIHKHAK